MARRPPYCSRPHAALQVISDVLSEYGDNIDAAIKHLTDLRLATPSTSAAATPEQQAAAAAAAGQHAAEQQRQQEQATQQQQEQAQQPQQGAADAGAAGQPRSAEEWIDVVVREMAAATNLADARTRASKVLQAFEQAAVQHAKQVGLGQVAQVGQEGAVGGLPQPPSEHAMPAAPNCELPHLPRSAGSPRRRRAAARPAGGGTAGEPAAQARGGHPEHAAAGAEVRLRAGRGDVLQ